MITKRIEKYCKDYKNIENYSKAISDTTQIWQIHHRREIYEGLSVEELKKMNLYYNVSPNELIFLTITDHRKLHSGENHPMYGKTISEETRRKQSKTVKDKYKNGYINSFKGHSHTEETKKKNSEWHKEYYKTHEGIFKGRSHTEESKKKNSEWHKEYYKNGGINGMKNKQHTEESKRKNSETHKKNYVPRHRVYHDDGTYHYEKNIINNR